MAQIISLRHAIPFFRAELKMSLLLNLQHKFILELGLTVGGDMGIGGNGVDGDDVGGGGGVGGGGVNGGDDMFELETDMLLSPTKCGMLAITGGLLGSWHFCLRLAGGDRLVIASMPPPTAPAVSFLDVVHFACSCSCLCYCYRSSWSCCCCF